ncbi:MAG TPA: phosphoenolpyruvate carboxykinase [Negativicutes bacterium]|nr:phosphoenolpyruvate carboxykinase [Negativicutes bacterium]
MNIVKSKVFDRKVVIRLKDRVCETPDELLRSELFGRILNHVLAELGRRQSRLLNIFPDKRNITSPQVDLLLETIRYLCKMPIQQVPQLVPGSEPFTHDAHLLEEFLRYVYNSWRNFDRFLICDSSNDSLADRPYRTFQTSAEQLMHIIRHTWRDIYANVSGQHPNIYRQVTAGVGMAAITDIRDLPYPLGYESLNKVPLIRHVMLYPPLVINPPMNTRTGSFEQVFRNPLDLIALNPDEWLCYPALVGKLLVNIYFHETFYDLGFALTNLFELADDEALANRRPDAVFVYGAQGAALDGFGVFPTVFYDDEANKMLVGAVPGRPEFGYFGYLKKMALTLHNICVMKEQRLPFHGALFQITLKGGKQSTILVMGDTGAGKSETLEAFRVLGADEIQDIIVIADDMGSLDINEQGQVLGYGTEVGAFVRLDDLQPGYAFGQIDRIIMMNAGQTNARIVVPITTYKHVVCGYPIDIVLYCSNFELVDDTQPVLQRFANAADALPVFRAGASMSKGTTSSTGLTHSYFANVFGPMQFPKLHDKLAERYFQTFDTAGIFVGQMRTRLSINGWEQKGPEAAAAALLEVIRSRP